MLACQSIERLRNQTDVAMSKHLLWRAMLQVILIDVTGVKSDDWRVGRIGHKCHDFTEYVHKAMTKLNVTHSVSAYWFVNNYLLYLEIHDCVVIVGKW